MTRWLEKYDDNRKQDFTRALFSILKKADVNDIVELKKAKISNMIKILKQMKSIDKETKVLLTSTLKDLYEEWRV